MHEEILRGHTSSRNVSKERGHTSSRNVPMLVLTGIGANDMKKLGCKGCHLKEKFLIRRMFLI